MAETGWDSRVRGTWTDSTNHSMRATGMLVLASLTEESLKAGWMEEASRECLSRQEAPILEWLTVMPGGCRNRALSTRGISTHRAETSSLAVEEVSGRLFWAHRLLVYQTGGVVLPLLAGRTEGVALLLLAGRTAGVALLSTGLGGMKVRVGAGREDGGGVRLKDGVDSPPGSEACHLQAAAPRPALSETPGPVTGLAMAAATPTLPGGTPVTGVKHRNRGMMIGNEMEDRMRERTEETEVNMTEETEIEVKMSEVIEIEEECLKTREEEKTSEGTETSAKVGEEEVRLFEVETSLTVEQDPILILFHC